MSFEFVQSILCAGLPSPVTDQIMVLKKLVHPKQAANFPLVSGIDTSAELMLMLVILVVGRNTNTKLAVNVANAIKAAHNRRHRV